MCSRGQRGNLGEPTVSLPQVRRRGTDDKQEPGQRVGKLQPTRRTEKDGTRTKEENARYRGTSESKGTRDGLLAVVAEHSTDELASPVREGGEPRPKGPTVGKVKPGITFCLEET
jgi:hypothetical protein